MFIGLDHFVNQVKHDLLRTLVFAVDRVQKVELFAMDGDKFLIVVKEGNLVRQLVDRGCALMDGGGKCPQNKEIVGRLLFKLGQVPRL